MYGWACTAVYVEDALVRPDGYLVQILDSGRQKDYSVMAGIIESSTGFVRDVSDFASIQLSKFDVQRGDLRATHYGGWPGRAVNALLAARLAGDQRLASAALAVINSPEPYIDASGAQYNFRSRSEIVRDDWEKVLKIAINFDVPP
jgi:hypothetical protein